MQAEEQLRTSAALAREVDEQRAEAKRAVEAERRNLSQARNALAQVRTISTADKIQPPSEFSMTPSGNTHVAAKG